jgi:hypothetical protein
VRGTPALATFARSWWISTRVMQSTVNAMSVSAADASAA